MAYLDFSNFLLIFCIPLINLKCPKGMKNELASIEDVLKDESFIYWTLHKEK